MYLDRSRIMDTFDPQGKRFLILSLLMVLFGVGAVRGGFDALSDPTLAPHGASERMVLWAIKAIVAAIGVVCFIIAKKLVDKYADRRPR